MVMIKNRNHTIDIAKGVGIILVVFGHSWMVSHGNREVFRIVFSFHMPLFLFLSGVFLNEKNSFKDFLISRAHSILKPYFVTLTTLGLLKLSFDVMNKKDYSLNFLNYMSGVLYGTGSTIAWPPLWYLPHLFIVSCVALFLIKHVASIQIQWLILTASLMFGILLLNNIVLSWSIDLIPITLFFFVAGYLLRGFVKTMLFNFGHLLLSLLLFFLLHYFFDDTIDLNLRVYDSLAVSTVKAILGIYICLSVSSFLTKYVFVTKILGYIGSGTLFILLFHSYVQDKIFGLLVKPFGESVSSEIIGLTAGVAFPLILWECSKRSYYLSALFLPKIPMSRASIV
jgi:fucose 4-O-acetylase-like acetyltransferase